MFDGKSGKSNLKKKKNKWNEMKFTKSPLFSCAFNIHFEIQFVWNLIIMQYTISHRVTQQCLQYCYCCCTSIFDTNCKCARKWLRGYIANVRSIKCTIIFDIISNVFFFFLYRKTNQSASENAVKLFDNKTSRTFLNLLFSTHLYNTLVYYLRNVWNSKKKKKLEDLPQIYR